MKFLHIAAVLIGVYFFVGGVACLVVSLAGFLGWAVWMLRESERRKFLALYRKHYRALVMREIRGEFARLQLRKTDGEEYGSTAQLARRGVFVTKIKRELDPRRVYEQVATDPGFNPAWRVFFESGHPAGS